MLRNQRLQSARRAFGVVLRRVRINDIVGEEFAGLIDDGDLAAGPDTRVDAEHGDCSGGRSEQQILQVVAEHLNGFGIGALLQFQADFGLNRRLQKALPCVVCGKVQLRRPIARLLVDMRFDEGQSARRFQLDAEVEDLLVFAAADRQHAMRRNRLRGLAIVVIHLKFLFRVFRVVDFAADDDSLGHHRLAQ
jgi:hypothetical protein